MMDESAQTLVLRDTEGYYLLTPEQLAQARVPADRAAELEALVQGDDTAGFRLDISESHVPVGLVALPNLGVLAARGAAGGTVGGVVGKLLED